MPHASRPLTAATLLASLALALPVPAPAQNDPAAMQLIEQLRPRTRGIRLPTPAESPAPAGDTAAPPGAPGTAGAPSAQPPPATVNAPPAYVAAPTVSVPPTTPAAPSVISTATTAPEGAAAVSLTVNFATGSASLTPQAEALLASLGRALSSPDLTPYRFRIEGHTDTVGDAPSNQRLSERRAAAVMNYLIYRFGVSPARLEAIGFGETTPLVPTQDSVGEPRNRRVQVVNLDG